LPDYSQQQEEENSFASLPVSFEATVKVGTSS
jgi:hypothetical protein